MISASFLFQQDHNAAAAELWSLETTDLLEPNKETVTCMQSARESLLLICELSWDFRRIKKTKKHIAFSIWWSSTELRANCDGINYIPKSFNNTGKAFFSVTAEWCLLSLFLYVFLNSIKQIQGENLFLRCWIFLRRASVTPVLWGLLRTLLNYHLLLWGMVL